MQIIFAPKKTKENYRKFFRGRLKSQNTDTLALTKGTIGIQVLENGRISTEQLEAFRRMVRKRIKRKGKLLFVRKPNLLLTAKPAEVRMGSGKGAPAAWVIRMHKGFILAEIKGVATFRGCLAFKKAMKKLSVKTRIVHS